MCRIPLTKGHFALVDAEDFERLSAFKWCAWSSPKRPGLVYAIRAIKRAGGRTTTMWMHREILGATERRVFVDHRDHDGLNNTRENLRLCTRRQNAWNIGSSPNQKRGGFKGVSLDKPTGKWVAKLGGSRGPLYLGLFKSAEDAARAYDRAARENFGEFAGLNFPDTANDSAPLASEARRR